MPLRVFLDWSQPLLPSLAGWLLTDAPRFPAPAGFPALRRITLVANLIVTI